MRKASCFPQVSLRLLIPRRPKFFGGASQTGFVNFLRLKLVIIFHDKIFSMLNELKIKIKMAQEYVV
jgi:hypothetical protein